ncbi:Acg family FMN-binding oxidoreductase [Streptomyces alkaliphilus]|uniref:Acg family FMN-binding oxidoreductase n=1 Tax=Streptomyces alkaliphilus TaxID=1472722 RepID=UPI00117C71E8|nr:nitroreductase [Streptomyces alkaliphilus]
MVREASLAPSLYNAQPWRFAYSRSGREFSLRADRERGLPHMDPDARELHMGCGAALFNLRVAAVARGLRPEVSLLPHPEDPDLLARVRLTSGESPVNGRESEGIPGDLHPALFERHTSRYPFWDTDIPQDARTLLRTEAAAEGAALVFADAPERDLVLRLSALAEHRNAADPGRREELLRWTRPRTSVTGTEADGIPDYAFGPRPTAGGAPLRDYAAGRVTAPLGTTGFEENPRLAFLTTPEDTPLHWLRAGQAMERVLLRATREGLSALPVTHPLEWPDLRREITDSLPGNGTVQMVLRLGHGPLGPVTPRRRIEEVLDITG